MKFIPALEEEFQKIMATPIDQKALTPDQARNAERLKAWEERKKEQSK